MALLYDGVFEAEGFLTSLTANFAYESTRTTSIRDGHEFVDVSRVEFKLFSVSAYDATLSVRFGGTPGLNQKVVSLPGSSTRTIVAFDYDPPLRVFFSGTSEIVVIELTRVSSPAAVYWPGVPEGEPMYHYPQCRLYGDLGDSDTLSKPTTPSPADASGPGIDFSGWTIGWVDGGGAETFDVFMGTSPSTLNRVVEGTALTSHTFEVGQRPPVTGGVIYWRVDAIAGEDRVTGDVWSFDPRPAAAEYVAPLNEAADQTRHVDASWDEADAATTYEFRIIRDGGVLPTVITGLTETQLSNIGSYLSLAYDTKYYWRIDTRNQFGVTEGSSWWFRTVKLDYVIPSWEHLPDKTLGPTTGGTLGVDFRWTGENSMVTTKRLVAAARNRIWYEEV